MNLKKHTEVLNGLQYANFDVELELDAQPLWHIVNNDLPIIGEQVLDIATLLEQQEDLEDVSLNEEDYRDLRAMRQSSEELTRLNPDEDINLVDEAESYPKQVTGDGSEEKFETNFENEHHKEDELRFPEVDIEQPITYPEDNER